MPTEDLNTDSKSGIKVVSLDSLEDPFVLRGDSM
jgi:hypothetical protein